MNNDQRAEEQLAVHGADSDERVQLRMEQVKLLYTHAPIVMIATAANSVILTVILWNVISHGRLILWLASSLLLLALRTAQVQAARRTHPEMERPLTSTKTFLIGLALSGLVMGSAGLFLFPVHSPTHQIFLVLVLGSMVAGAVGAYSLLLEAFLAYSLPVVTPTMLRLLSAGTDMQLAMGLMLLLFSAIMLVTAYSVHKATMKSLKVRFENSCLITHLRSATAKAERATEELRTRMAERLQAESAMREGEQRFRMIFENSPVGIMHFDGSGTVTDYNNNLAKISGSPKGQFIGLNLLSTVQDERMRGAIADCIAGKRTHYEGDYRSALSAKVTAIRADFAPILFEDGAVLGGIGIVEDISDRKRAQEEVQDQLHFLQTLIDTIPNPIFYKDTEGHYLGCNKAFEARMGHTKEEVIGKTAYDILPKELADKYHEMDEELLRNGGVQTHEHSIVYAGGRLHNVIVNKATFTNRDGTLAGLVGVNVDITERKEAEEALRKAHDQLEVRVEERTRELAHAIDELQNEVAVRKQTEEALLASTEKLKLFAYSVVHDLKSPAIGIYGLARLLHERYYAVLDEKGRKFCEQILKASEHVADLVEKINVYMAAKESPVTFETMNLQEVLRMVKDEFSSQFSLRQIEWIEPPAMPEIKADRLSMLRVFRNLIDNALKYGGESLSEIRIGYEDAQEAHILSVTDNGVGIRQENPEKLFGVFQRDSTPKSIEGSGLGLAIVKEVAERHQGSVWVEPGPGAGITFRIAISKHL